MPLTWTAGSRPGLSLEKVEPGRITGFVGGGSVAPQFKSRDPGAGS